MERMELMVEKKRIEKETLDWAKINLSAAMMERNLCQPIS